MKCKICSSNITTLKYRKVDGYKIKRTFRIVECSNCKVCFTDPFLSKQDYQSYHNKHQVAFNGSGDDSVINEYLANKEGQWYGLGYISRLQSIQRIRPQAKRFLDIGCGAGLYLDYLKSKGHYVEGIELSPWGYKVATERLGIKVHNNLLEKLKKPKIKFDVITLYDVIEHTTDPNSFLQELKKWITKDGIVVVNLPNIDSNISNAAKCYWNKLSPPDHTFHFNKESVSYLLNKNGYQPISIKTNSGDPGESLSQLTVGFWVRVAKHSKKVSNALPMLNKPLARNKPILVRILKGSRKAAFYLGPAIKPFLSHWNRKNKGEGLNIICKLY